MSNKDFQDNAEGEILSVGDVKIRQMIKNLQRVDAPKDFDFRLKARIANTKPTEFQPRFFPVLRYVLPLSVVVLIFTFVIINGVYFGENNQMVADVQPISVEHKVIPTPEFLPLPVEPASDTNSAVLVQPKVKVKKRELIPPDKNQLVAVNLPRNPKTELPKGIINDDGAADGGSRTADSRPPEVKTPRGIPSNDLTESSPNNENKNDIITKQILLPRGIEIVSENGKRRVKAVKKESIAARSGVRVGDLVEAIDGEKVSGDAVRGKKLEGKQITVLRGTEKVEITFDNQ